MDTTTPRRSPEDELRRTLKFLARERRRKKERDAKIESLEREVARLQKQNEVLTFRVNTCRVLLHNIRTSTERLLDQAKKELLNMSEMR
jgi:archaellum component FlaC